MCVYLPIFQIYVRTLQFHLKQLQLDVHFFQPKIEFSTYVLKQCNLKQSIKYVKKCSVWWRAFLTTWLATVSIHNEIIVWYENDYFSKIKKPSFVMPSKTLWIVAHCMPFVPPSCFCLAGNSRNLAPHSQMLLRCLSLLLTVQGCVVPLDYSAMFYSFTLMHAPTPSWFSWTAGHAHFRVL